MRRRSIARFLREHLYLEPLCDRRGRAGVCQRMPRPDGPASPSRASMDGEALKVSSLTRDDDEEKKGLEAGKQQRA